MNAWLTFSVGLLIGTAVGMFFVSILTMGRREDDKARIDQAKLMVEEALREIDLFSLEDPAWAIKTPTTRTAEAYAVLFRLRKILLRYSTFG